MNTGACGSHCTCLSLPRHLHRGGLLHRLPTLVRGGAQHDARRHQRRHGDGVSRHVPSGSAAPPEPPPHLHAAGQRASQGDLNAREPGDQGPCRDGDSDIFAWRTGSCCRGGETLDTKKGKIVFEGWREESKRKSDVCPNFRRCIGSFCRLIVVVLKRFGSSDPHQVKKFCMFCRYYCQFAFVFLSSKATTRHLQCQVLLLCFVPRIVRQDWR